MDHPRPMEGETLQCVATKRSSVSGDDDHDDDDFGQYILVKQGNLSSSNWSLVGLVGEEEVAVLLLILLVMCFWGVHRFTISIYKGNLHVTPVKYLWCGSKNRK